MLSVILLQHFAEVFHGLALGLLLGQFTHIDFSKVALHRVFDEGFIGFTCLRALGRG